MKDLYILQNSAPAAHMYHHILNSGCRDPPRNLYKARLTIISGRAHNVSSYTVSLVGHDNRYQAFRQATKSAYHRYEGGASAMDRKLSI